MDLCHLKSSELEPQFQKYKGRVVLRGDIVKDDSGSYAVFTEQGSTASANDGCKCDGFYIKTTRMRRTNSRRKISLYRSKNGRCFIGKKPEVGVSRHLDSSTTTQMAEIMVQYGRPSPFLLSEICTVILYQDYYGKGNSRKFYQNTVGKNSKLRMLIRLTRRTILVCVCG